MASRHGWPVLRAALCAGLIWTGVGGARVATAQSVQMPQMPQLPQLPSAPNVPSVLVGTLAAPVITWPKNGAMVKSPIVVRGTAGRGVKITVTATLTTSPPISGVTAQAGQANTTADAAGTWQVSITPKIPLGMSTSAVKIELIAVATNPTTGQKSKAAKVDVVPHA